MRDRFHVFRYLRIDGSIIAVGNLPTLKLMWCLLTEEEQDRADVLNPDGSLATGMTNAMRKSSPMTKANWEYISQELVQLP
jgi:hypothetical protein